MDKLDQIKQDLRDQISTYTQALQLLEGVNGNGTRRPGRPRQTSNVVSMPSKRRMSAEGRANIRRAVKARWAKWKKAHKKAA